MEDDLDTYSPGPPAPVLSLSPSHSTLRPIHTHTPHSKSYVLSLALLPQNEGYVASFSAPENALSLLDGGTLRERGRLEGHEAGVTGLEVLQPSQGLLSSSADGTVRRWDLRSRQAAGVLKPGGKRAGLLSVAAAPDGWTVAAGAELTGDDALIHFWDLRQPTAPTHTHSSTHSDDITTLSFHPFLSTNPRLLSGSTDGLVSLTNAREQDEDEAVVEVGNWGTSVADAGWSSTASTDGEGGRVWARSDMETVSIWDGELTMLRDFGDARRPAVKDWQTDYIISCSFHSHSQSQSQSQSQPQPHPDSQEQELQILAGSNEGGFAHISAAGGDAWIVRSTYEGGHEGIVRCVLYDPEHGRLISGGEDGRVVVWPYSPTAAAGPDGGRKEEEEGREEEEMEVDVPRVREREEEETREQRPRKKKRFEPYGRSR